VTVQYAPEDTADFTPYIDKVLSSSATVVVPIWVGGGAVTLFHQLYDLGVYKHMNVTTGIPDMTSFNFLLVGEIPVFVGMTKYAFNLPNNAVNNWLVQNYVTMFKKDALPEQSPLFFPLPDIFIPDSFATGQAIVTALDMTGGNPGAPGMIQALQGMYLNTPKGPMYIRPQDHQALQDMYIVKAAYTNSTIQKYYTGPLQMPSSSYWVAGSGSTVNIFKTGFWGARLIETLDEAQTAPPIYPDTVTAPRPPVTYAITCSSSTLGVGAATLCKATVTKTGSKAPTGTVQWSLLSSVSSGSGKFSKLVCKLSGGACTVKFTSSVGGPVFIETSYSGDSNYKPAAAGYSLLVVAATSKTSLSCSPKSVVAGSSKVITCKAKVTGYSPTGTVSWTQSGTGSVSFSSATCTLVKGACSVTLTGKTAGTVALQATYSGDSNNEPSSQSVTLTIK
jgi:hypothetical protein